jgi:hypothetical protein
MHNTGSNFFLAFSLYPRHYICIRVDCIVSRGLRRLPREDAPGLVFHPRESILEGIVMKKIIVAIACMIGIASLIYGMGDTTEARKTVCDKGCQVAYDTCMKAAQKVVDKIASSKDAATKQKAEEATCQKAKDLCIKKCTPAPAPAQTQTKQ